jgi:hypothetical protein
LPKEIEWKEMDLSSNKFVTNSKYSERYDALLNLETVLP